MIINILAIIGAAAAITTLGIIIYAGMHINEVKKDWEDINDRS